MTLKVIKHMFRRLTKRYQVVIRDTESLAERYVYDFSYAKLITMSGLSGVLFMTCGLILATSLLGKWFNPAYVAKQNQQKIQQLASAVNTLEEQTLQQKKFITLLQHIIAGKDPSVSDRTTIKNVPTSNTLTPTYKTSTSTEVPWNGQGNSSPSPTASKINDLQGLIYWALISNDLIIMPLEDRVKSPKVYDIASTHAPIRCVEDGVIAFSAWTMATGWVTIIQHDQASVSMYKHHAILGHKVGGFVKAGEPLILGALKRQYAQKSPARVKMWYEKDKASVVHFANF